MWCALRGCPRARPRSLKPESIMLLKLLLALITFYGTHADANHNKYGKLCVMKVSPSGVVECRCN